MHLPPRMYCGTNQMDRWMLFDDPLFLRTMNSERITKGGVKDQT